MRFVQICALVTLMAAACSLPTGDTATPRPTYTPYPTFTPEASTAGSPTEMEGQESAPGEYVEIGGQKDWFFGTALFHAEKGMSEFRGENYLAAIESLEEAQRHRDKPSAVLNSWMGLAYQALGRYQEAVRHHTTAIKIEDSVSERTNRGHAYLLQGVCELAIADAKAALAMEPQSVMGLHTDAEANYILGNCLAYDGEYLLALQHAEAALEISRENNYQGEYLADRESLVTQIRDQLDPSKPDSDFLLITALDKMEQGIEDYNAGDYQGAIESFEAAKDHHGKPSGVIESWLGLSFQALGQQDQAIAHFSESIKIADSAVDRLNRSVTYSLTGQCSLAVDDAKASLSLPPHQEDGYHSEVEANSILVECYADAGDYRLAMVHAEAALNGAISHNYPADDIAILLDNRDFIKSLADAQE